jgi:hypothetical protein
MSFLNKFINGTNYTGFVEFGRKSNDSILKFQEPVGYRYFSHGNVEYLLTLLRPAHGEALQFGDIQRAMFNHFYMYGSNKSGYVDPGNSLAIGLAVKLLNMSTVKEVNKRLGNNTYLYRQYQTILANPNRVAANPKRGDQIWNKESENSRYGPSATRSEVNRFQTDPGLFTKEGRAYQYVRF